MCDGCELRRRVLNRFLLLQEPAHLRRDRLHARSRNRAHVARRTDLRPSAPPVVDVVVPVFNEERALEPSVHRLHAYLTDAFPFSWRITIVDNASTDGTWLHAQRLARELPGVRARHLDRKGRGLALRTAWSASDADVVAYMDVDLSTDLDALLPLVAPLVSGHSDVAIGSRLAPGSHVARHPKRELISRSYNLILRTVLATRVRDAQCGFKAVRAERRAEAPARGRGRRLVLRHRAPAARGAQRSADPRSAGRLDRRHRQPCARRVDCDRRPAGNGTHGRRFATGGGRVELGPVARAPSPMTSAAASSPSRSSVSRAPRCRWPCSCSTSQRDRCDRGQRRRGHGDVRRQRLGERPLHRTQNAPAWARAFALYAMRSS